MSVKERITRAKIQLQKKQPFFAYLLMHLRTKKVDDEWFEKLKEEMPELEKVIGPFTMGVDNYGNMYYSEKWVKSLSEQELEGVMCHEVLHCALNHLDRVGSRNHKCSNIAQDLVVNEIVMNCREGHGRMFDLPEGGAIPENHEFEFKLGGGKGFKVKNIHKKSWEEIYDEIYPKLPKIKITIQQGGSGGGFDQHIRRKGGKGRGKDKDKKGKQGKGGKGKGGGSRGKKKQGPGGMGKKQISKKDWQRVIAEAATYAKQRGNLPAGMERRIEGLLQSKISWKDLLWKYLTREIPYDYTYQTPHKKSISAGFYIPNVKRENLEIIVSVDTSGSIGNKELKEFLTEVVSMARSFQNVKMTLVVCDAEIHDVYTVSNGSIDKIMDLKMRGGGGTSHKPVFKWINKNKPMTRVMMALTDGFTSFPERVPPYHVIWVLSSDSCDPKDIPFGSIVKIKNIEE